MLVYKRTTRINLKILRFPYKVYLCVPCESYKKRAITDFATGRSGNPVRCGKKIRRTELVHKVTKLFCGAINECCSNRVAKCYG